MSANCHCSSGYHWVVLGTRTIIATLHNSYITHNYLSLTVALTSAQRNVASSDRATSLHFQPNWRLTWQCKPVFCPYGEKIVMCAAPDVTSNKFKSRFNLNRTPKRLTEPRLARLIFLVSLFLQLRFKLSRSRWVISYDNGHGILNFCCFCTKIDVLWSFVNMLHSMLT